MKNLYLLVSILLFSCHPESLNNYKGAIVHYKYRCAFECYVVLEQKYDTISYIKQINVTKYHFNKYNEGDTIK